MWEQLSRQLGAGVGSGIVHAVGLIALATGMMPNRNGDISIDPAWWPISPKHPKPFLIFSPVPLQGTRRESLVRVNPDRCATPRPDTVPARLLDRPARPATWRARRDPRLCLRVGSDGRVLAAQILTSSRNAQVDRDAEALARALTFVPAHRDGEAVASTVTYDALGNDRR